MRYIIYTSNKDTYENIVHFLKKDKLSKDTVYSKGGGHLSISEEQVKLLKLIGLEFKIVRKEED